MSSLGPGTSECPPLTERPPPPVLMVPMASPDGPAQRSAPTVTRWSDDCVDSVPLGFPPRLMSARLVKREAPPPALMVPDGLPRWPRSTVGADGHPLERRLCRLRPSLLPSLRSALDECPKIDACVCSETTDA